VGEYGHGLTARIVHVGCCGDGPAIEPAATRRFDGAPETDADRRFFDLRESGYTGWIDQDGCPVDGPTFVRTLPGTVTSGAIPAVPATVTALITPAVTLRAAATYIVRYGWCQGGYYEQTDRGILPAACIVAAIGMVCYGYQVDAPAMNFEDPGWGDFEAAVAWLDRYLAARYGLDDNGLPVEAYSFNDTRGRLVQEVIAALREAAHQWDTEHAWRIQPAEEAEEPAESVDGDSTPGGVA
jgi:hypothetical protein